MIDRKVIEDLIKMMVEHEIVELDVADGDQSVTLRRAGAYANYAAPAAAMPASQLPPQPMMGSGASGAAAPTSSSAPASAASGGADSKDEGNVIKSPMVGTFYSRPNPDTDSFVSIGAKVSESSVVCLIEAMKVFNEIKAECKGTITEILVNDGDAVEYGQPMFRFKPA